MPMHAAAQPQTRNDVHTQIDLIGQIWVESDKASPCGVRTAARTFERGELLEATLVLVIEGSQRCSGTRLFIQNPFGGNFGNVGLFEINGKPKPVLKPC